jgi:hypothetical protein
MLYMLLICYDPTRPTDPERRNLQPEHAKLEAELRTEGTYVSGAGLWPAAQSKVVRRSEGKVIRTDGAFAETKEVVGGYFIVHCDERRRWRSRSASRSTAGAGSGCRRWRCSVRTRSGSRRWRAMCILGCRGSLLTLGRKC